jgi:hypothetical protein
MSGATRVEQAFMPAVQASIMAGFSRCGKRLALFSPSGQPDPVSRQFQIPRPQVQGDRRLYALHGACGLGIEVLRQPQK